MNFRISFLKGFSDFSFILKKTYTDLPKGIEYPGFIYYPKHEGFKDPPYEPSKLFFVKRIKPMRGRTKVEKANLGYLNIDGPKKFKKHQTVVKNIPETNALLWKVKHLVEIKPLMVKGELPKDGDFSGTYLRDNGEFIVSPKLKCSTEQIENSTKMLTSDKRLSRKYFLKYLRLKWLKGYDVYD